MAESYKMDMLRIQLAGLTPNGSANEDENCNLVENLPDSKKQELKSVSETEAVSESTAGDFDSTESFKLPSPPVGSPGAAVANDSGLCSAVSTSTADDVVDSRSISSRASLDSYFWSTASSELPSWSLPEDEERFIWPSKVLDYSKH